MYPFYSAFFRTIHQLFGLADAYAKQQPYIISGNEIINTRMCGFALPRIMKAMMMYAPREYFTEECHHYTYLNLCYTLLKETLGGVRAALPQSAKYEAGKCINRITTQFAAFIHFPSRPTHATVREYAALIDKIVDPFEEAFQGLAAEFDAAEDIIRDAKPTAPGDDKIVLAEIKDNTNQILKNQKDHSNALRRIHDALKHVGDLIERIFKHIRLLFVPKDYDGHLVLEMMENEGRCDSLAHVENKAHREQLKCLIAYTKKHPVIPPSQEKTSKYGPSAGIKIPDAVKAVLTTYERPGRRILMHGRMTRKGKKLSRPPRTALPGKRKRHRFTTKNEGASAYRRMPFLHSNALDLCAEVPRTSAHRPDWLLRTLCQIKSETRTSPMFGWDGSA